MGLDTASLDSAMLKTKIQGLVKSFGLPRLIIALFLLLLFLLCRKKRDRDMWLLNRREFY